MNNQSDKSETTTRDTVSTKEAGEILGLKYHHARLLLYNCNSVGCYEYGKIKRWVLADVLAYKKSHYKKPLMVMGE